MKSWKLFAVLLSGAVLAAGCGGDDDDSKSGGKGSAGSGGSMAPDSGDGDDHMVELPPGAVACGNTACEPPEGVTMVTPCCYDAFAAKCGMMQGMSCVAEVEMDPRCPSVSAGGMFTLASCCIEETNMCGINTSMFGGSPCTELGEAAMMAMMRGGGGFITFPAAKTCD